MDEISAAFATLTPEMLLRETSAISDAEMAFDSVGEPLFDEFVEGMIKICWERTKNETFEAFAVLSSTRRRRIFIADGDETPDDWAERLRREAVTMDATWVFISMLAPARTYEEGYDHPRPIDKTVEAIDEALDEGELSVGVCWQAERKDAKGVSARAGYIALDENAMPDTMTEGILDPIDNTFRDVLPGG